MSAKAEMESGKGGRRLPKTRIATLFVYINAFSLALTVAAAALGAGTRMVKDLLYWHIPAGLIAAVAGLFALVAAMFYLVASGGGIREAVAANGLPPALMRRAAPLKKEFFPFCILTITLLIAMTVAGAGVHTGKVDKNIHLVLAVITVAAHYYTIRKAIQVFGKNRELMADIMDAINATAA